MLNLRKSPGRLYLSLFVGYLLLAFTFASFSSLAQVIYFWPPAGLALAACSRFGYRFVPAVFIGSFVFNSLTQITGPAPSFNLLALAQSALIAFGASLQLAVNFYCLKRLNWHFYPIPAAKKIVLFILLALAATTIGALIGNLSLSRLDAAAFNSATYWTNVLVWWLGDFLGIIITFPIVAILLNTIISSKIRRKLTQQVVYPLLILMSFFILIQHYLDQQQLKSTQEYTQLKARIIENNLRRQLSQHVNLANTLAQAIEQKTQLSLQQFEQITELLLASHRAVRALSWNEVVHPENTAEFILRAQNEIDRDFKISGTALTAEDPLVVVKYITPLATNKSAQGFNLFSEPVRKKALIRAQKLGTAVASPNIQLKQAAKSAPGFLIFSPVYSTTDTPLVSALSEPKISQTRSLLGYATGVFDVATIVEQSLNEDDLKLFKVEISEGLREKQLVFDHFIDAPTHKAKSLRVDKFQIDFASNRWQVELFVDPVGITTLQAKNSITFLFGESLIGSLVILVLLISFAQRSQLEQDVRARTKELERLNQKLVQYAFDDELTGLPNRRLFNNRLNHGLELAREKAQSIAVLCVDLNQFKRVNDSLGHQVGDRLLVKLARRLKGCLSEGDTIARFGGDEFAILLEDNPSRADCDRIGLKLGESLRVPFEIGDESILTAISVGVAIYPDDGDNPGDIFRAADTAMHRAKSSEQFLCFYSESLRVSASEQLFIDNELPYALEAHQFELYYQPIVSLSPLRHIGCECLIRWRHPVHGIIPPDKFIPAAERSGLIMPIGQWVLEQACQQIKRWASLKIPHEKVSLNVSAKQLQQPDFHQQVERTAQRLAIKPSLLHLEVTENALLHNIELAVSCLTHLRQQKFKVAIDDYGTGYASLAYLKQLPVDSLKIDRAFISEFHYSSHDLAIVRSTVSLAKELQLDVIAEGVENNEQLALLTSIGCQMAQGYLFSKPLPATDYEQFARSFKAARFN